MMDLIAKKSKVNYGRADVFLPAKAIIAAFQPKPVSSVSPPVADALFSNRFALNNDRTLMTFVASELGGSAGAVVASRLSDIPEWKVLLLEAGPDEPPGADVPSMVAMFLGKFQLDPFPRVRSAAIIYTFKSRYDNEYLECLQSRISFDFYFIVQRK